MSGCVPDIFRLVITDKFHISPIEDMLCIREEKIDAKCQWVKIKTKNSLPNFCFSIDHPRKKGDLDSIFPFFNVEQSGLCIKNDAILICQKKSDVYVFLIELKSNDKSEYLQQIKAAEIFSNFVIDRLNASKNPDFFINKEKIKFRGLLFKCRRVGREGTTRKKHKVQYQNRQELLVTENPCHQLYHLNQFLL